MDATAEYIRQHVKKMAVKRPPSIYKAQTIVIPPRKEKSNALANFLVFCIVIISLGTLAGMFLLSPKGQALLNPTKSEVRAERPTPPATVPDSVPDYMRREDAHSWMSAANTRLSKLEQDAKVMQHRVWLLGLATNENAALCDKMDADHHQVNQRGFVRVDENWKLSPLPKTMQLTDEMKREINEGPK